MGGIRKYIGFVIVLALLSATTIEEKQEELQDIQAELRRQQRLLQQVKRREQATLRDLVLLNRQVNRVKNDLTYNQYRLVATTKTLQQTRQELEKARAEFALRKKILSHRVREIYKSQDLGFMALLFSRKTFSELVDDFYFYRKILEKDISIMNEILAIRQNIQYKENQLEYQRRQIEEMHKAIQQQKQYYEAKAKEQQIAYRNIRAQREEYERRVDELLRNSKEIENMIKRMMMAAREARGTGQFIWPVRGMITSYYGRRRHPIFGIIRMHTGIDIAVNPGTPVRAADSGIVIFSGWWGGYGKAIIIDHGRGYSTVYAHLDRQYVRSGQKVDKYNVIGLSGNTGYSTGPHLHFEVRYNGETQDPMRYLR